MSALCNGTLLWDDNQTWYGSWPQFTDCFQTTVLVWVPCGWLWLTAPFYIYYILNVPPTVLRSRYLFIIKMMVCIALVIISAIELGETALQTSPEALHVEPALRTITFIFVLLLMFLERRKGLITSGVLFVFWVLLSVAGIVPFYTKIIQKSYDTDSTHFSLFYVHYGLVLVELLLSCFAETSSHNESSCPEVSSSFLSRITFWWANSLLFLGYKRTLTEQDISDLHPRDACHNNVPSFLSHWKRELNRQQNRSFERMHTQNKSGEVDERAPLIPKDQEEINGSADKKGHTSLARALLRTFWLEIIQSQIWKLPYDLLYFTNPLLLGLLIEFTEDKTSPVWKGYTLAAIMFCSTILQSVTFHATWHYSTSFALKVRSVLISAIFRKALTMNNQSRQESTTGEVINLMSVDTEHIKNTIQWMWASWSSLLQIILSLCLLYSALGLSMLAGLGVMVALMPLNYVTMTLWHRYQTQMMKLKDVRMKIINEVLNAMKIIKLYAWEPSFQYRIVDIRDKELTFIWKISMLEAQGIFTWTLSPYLVSLATFLTYIYTSSDHYLHPKTAFVAVALLNNLGYAVTALPEILSAYVQAYVSMMRITKYLSRTDLDKTQDQQDAEGGIDEAVLMKNATFVWNEDPQSGIRKINLRIQTGQLVAIVGQVGEGKSSLISAILGEMNKTQGHVEIKGRLAYIPQQAWIQNDTLQNNILFGKCMDRDFYDQVLDCCALKPDLDILPAGDLTEIGERGINLSGGQKQRVSLARAVYNNADIYLMDDPLSAVDSNVGKHIFSKLICANGLLRKKTRILVTHGVQWLPEVDSIIVMNNGEISERGTYQHLLHRNGPFANFLHNYLLTDGHDESEIQQTKHRTQKERAAGGDAMEVFMKCPVENCDLEEDVEYLHEDDKPRWQLVEDEEAEEGRVKWSVYRSYAEAVSYKVLVLCGILYGLYQAGSMTSNIWLSQWTDNTDLNNLTLYPPNSSERQDKNNYYLGVYGGLGFAQAVCMLTFSFLWASRSVHVSRVLHNRMLASVIRAPMSFFDTTPTGRIINRFSQDIDTIDLRMQHLLQYAFNMLFLVLSCVIVISYSTPMFSVVILPLFMLYYCVQIFYVSTSRQLKRLESKTRSPIYSYFGETLSGSAIIRAFKAQSRFIKESDMRVDRNQQFAFYGFVAQRWLGFRLETFGNFIKLAACMFAVSSRESLSGGTVGLSISYALQITQNLYYLVRMVSELETQVVCVERVKQHTDVKSEADWSVPEHNLDPSWPLHGKVEILNYSTRYRQGLDLVLKGISCTIRQGEKIGIVGRTGAGKSSLTLSLFRLIEPVGGQINIDGVDISTIGLHDLRRRLTILPQDPVLFTGSVRSNVDPFNVYSDSEIWKALGHAHLKNFVERLPGRLDHDCSEGGENLSVGQRQLLCLTRALLRKTKILILDEATAAVDMETDDLIQQTIRSEFKDCTVLTIAHRLNTVMDYDRILVFDGGCLVECDTPPALLQQPDSLFYNMVLSAGLATKH